MRLRIVLVLAACSFDSAFELAISPAFPALREQLGASPTALSWSITGYVLAAAVALPLVGPLGNRYGRRKVLLASLGAFVAGAVVCAAANDVGVFIAGRIIQGLGGGVGVLAVSIAAERLDPAAVPRGIGIIVGGGGLGGVLGLLVTGLLVDYVSVTAVFVTMAAVAAITAIAVWRTVEESPIYSQERVDVIGAVLLGAALGTVMLAVSKGNEWGWSSSRIVALLAGFVVLMGAWVRQETRTPNPLVDLRPLTRRPIWSADLAVFGLGFAFFIPFTFVPLLAGYPVSTGYGLGLGGTAIASLMLPGVLAIVVGGVVGGRIVARVGARRLTFVAAGFAVLAYTAFVVLPTTVAALAVGLIPLGLGIGLGICSLVSSVVRASNAEETSVATGLNVTARSVGQALGTQVAITVALAVPGLAPGLMSARGVDHAFVFGLFASLVAGLLFLVLPRAEVDPLVGRAASESELHYPVNTGVHAAS